MVLFHLLSSSPPLKHDQNNWNVHALLTIEPREKENKKEGRRFVGENKREKRIQRGEIKTKSELEAN